MSTVPATRRGPGTETRQVFTITLLLWLASGTDAAASPNDDGSVAEGLPGQTPQTVEVLPLRRGYYVASDTPCAQASNATLLLLRRNGIGGSRDFCEFERIRQTGATTYLVDEACADFQGGDPQTRQLAYTVVNEGHFLASGEHGVALDARYCAQTSLPPDWQHTDISADVE